MKRLVQRTLLSGLLLWPGLALADDREVKYTLLLIGGAGGILVGAGLYAALMILAAANIRHKALLSAAFVVCVGIFVFSQYTSIQTLRVALGLWQSPGAGPRPVGFTLWWWLGVVLQVGFGVAVFRFSLRLWQKRRRQRGPGPASRTSVRHLK
jgi:TRAP-type C4-dicarboxylate transport system permease small subunit